MAWTLKGTWFESCSCKMVCRCNFGPAEPDQGWCSGVLGFVIDSGESNGVDLGGTQLVLHGELPGDFTGGMDKAKLYLDERASDSQRAELEAIFQGKRGGVWEGVAGIIREFAPSQTARIDIRGGDSPSVKVEGIVDITMTRMKDDAGNQAVVVNAPIAAGFAVDTLELATAAGSVSDPDLRAWETLGYGAAVPFDWSY